MNIYELSKLFGIIGFISLYFQFIFSSKIYLIDRFFGLNKVYKIHKINGILSGIFIAFHIVFINIAIGDLPNNLYIFLGFLAAILLFVIFLTTILFNKLNLKYEEWKNIHRISYVVFFILFIHAYFLGSDIAYVKYLKYLWFFMLATTILIIFYKIINYIIIRNKPYKIKNIKKVNKDVWEIKIDKNELDFKPGQFIFIKTFINNKLSSFHPFTISSSPFSNFITINPKELGDYTSSLNNLNNDKSCFIDGPYGKFTIEGENADKFVFIAGGIGITPFLSMIRSIAAKDINKNILLIWGVKTQDDIIYKNELEKLNKNYNNINIRYVLSAPEDKDHGYDEGFINEKILQKYIKDFSNKKYYICGPPIMRKKIKEILKEKEIKGKNINYENFSL